MIKVIKNKKGMTLTELLVGLALFTIISTAVCAIFIPILNVYEKANALAEGNTLLDNIANQMISDLSQSTAVPTGLGATDSVTITINSPADVEYTAVGGVLQRNGATVLDADYYKNKSVSFVCDAVTDPGAPERAYTLAVTINMGSSEISRKYNVRPLALIPD